MDDMQVQQFADELAQDRDSAVLVISVAHSGAELMVVSGSDEALVRCLFSTLHKVAERIPPGGRP